MHRPSYDDWSLPKGKLQPGEAALLGAVREVLEETGHQVVVGRRLGVQRYDKELPGGPAPKVVRFWAMKSTGGSFDASDEVDDLRWLGLDAATTTVTLDRDRDVLQQFATGPHDTWPLVMVRHASAGSREKWRGDDARRPLDATGVQQAALLTDALACYGVRRLVSADVDRCTLTLAPYASAGGLTVETEHLLSEPGYADDPQGARDLCLSLLKDERPIAFCTQRKVLPPLSAALLPAYGARGEGISLAKGAFAVVHVAAGAAIDIEQHPPLAAETGDGGSHGCPG